MQCRILSVSQIFVLIPTLRTDVTSCFSVSVCCEVTRHKWTEREGELASNLVLILNGKNFNKCAQKDRAAALPFYGQVVFVTSIQIESQKFPQWDFVTFENLPWVLVGTDCSSQYSMKIVHRSQRSTFCFKQIWNWHFLNHSITVCYSV